MSDVAENEVPTPVAASPTVGRFHPPAVADPISRFVEVAE